MGAAAEGKGREGGWEALSQISEKRRSKLRRKLKTNTVLSFERLGPKNKKELSHDATSDVGATSTSRDLKPSDKKPIFSRFVITELLQLL